MSDEWVETTLGEAAEVLMGQSPPGHTYNDKGEGLPFLQGSAEFGDHNPEPVKWCSAPAKIAEVGDLMVSVRAPVGDTNFADQRIAIGRGLSIVRARDGGLTEFLRLVIQHQTAALLAASGSGMFSSITAANLRGFQFSLPPLPVQRRIVDLMAHLDNHLANLQTEREAAELTLHSVRRTLLQPSPDWESASLSDVAEVQLGRMLSKARAEGEDLAPYIRNANVQWDGLDLSDLKEMNFPEKERIKYSLRAGDILVCEGGDPGRAVLLKDDLPGIFYQKAVHRVRTSGLVEPGLLFEILAEAYSDGRIRDLCTNTTIKHLTAEKFKTLKVSFPPRDRQLSITELLATSRQHVTLVSRELVALQSVRASLLNGLLSGTRDLPESYDDFLPEVA